MVFEKPPLIIDNGSYSIKAGFSCDNHPISIFRNVVGRPQYLNGAYGKAPYEVYVGDNATECPEDLELNHPVVNGKIEHWDNMERVWHHIFYRTLKCAPEDRDVIITDATLSTMQEKLKTAEVFFEALNIPSLCIQPQSVLSMYGSGVTTGIAVDLGYDTASISPVYEGCPIKYAYMETGVAGAQVSEYIEKSLREENSLLDEKVHDVVEGIKRDVCYVSSNTTCVCSRDDEFDPKSYTLPDGQEIIVSELAFLAGELIFQPNAVTDRTDLLPLPDCLVTSARKCDADIRAEMYEATVLCGGLAMLPGIDTRLAAHVDVYERGVTVLTSSEAYCVAWLGAAVFANLPDVAQIWVNKKQYEEYGDRIIKNKFQ